MSDKPEEVEVFISLGGNIGDASIAIEDALSTLASEDDVRVTTRSPFYRTPPWGDTNQEEFVNACARIKTRLSPQDLLKTCLRVEKSMGRRRGKRWGPRIIDLDILTYGNETVSEKNLSIPHPFIAERAFVLVPLHDIAPDFELNGVHIDAMIEKLDLSGIQRMDPSVSASIAS